MTWIATSEGRPNPMEVPAITAVVPLYNGAPFIAEALRSIESQTLRPVRTIVVDDGSTDDGPAIVESLARDQTILLIRKSNGGQSSARNAGVARATTPLVAFLDQDDVWYPRHLEMLVTPFATAGSQRPGWVYGNLDTVDHAGRLLSQAYLDRFVRTEHPKRTLRGCLANDMFVLPSASLIDVAAFREIGGFDEALIGYEDDDLFVRMFMHGYRNVYVNETLSQWRMHPRSASGSPAMLRSRLAYFHKVREALSGYDPALRTFVDTCVSWRFFKATILDLQRASLTGDRDVQDHALTVLNALLPHVGSEAWLPARMMLPAARALRLPAIGRAAAWAAPVVWKAVRSLRR